MIAVRTFLTRLNELGGIHEEPALIPSIHQPEPWKDENRERIIRNGANRLNALIRAQQFSGAADQCRKLAGICRTWQKEKTKTKSR